MNNLTLLQQVKTYHKESFECISTALQIDENSNGMLAIISYKFIFWLFSVLLHNIKWLFYLTFQFIKFKLHYNPVLRWISVAGAFRLNFVMPSFSQYHFIPV